MYTFRYWHIQRRLHKLQRAYYDAPARNDAVIGEYLRVLDAARAAEVGDAPPLTCLHVGSGGHSIKGWINLDLDPTDVSVAANAAVGLPFRSASIDRLHSEDFIEHVDAEGGRQFLAEAFRVLRPGGVMRLLTPDLRAIIEHVYLQRQRRHLRWCSVYLDADGACEALNMHLRMNGEHRFLYDEEHLRRLLTAAGFAVRRVRYNWSPDRYLRFLDLRDFGLNLFLECVKPSSS